MIKFRFYFYTDEIGTTEYIDIFAENISEAWDIFEYDVNLPVVEVV